MRTSIPPARVATLRRRLVRWFAAARRDLPWRFPAGEADPYRVWISEAMLQQTQVATVIPYYLRFLERFPTLSALADGDEGEVLALWSGLGYYARARALLRAAREARARHGRLPGSVEALRELPGFGPYTAGAVASIAFGVATPAVDGNAARVLSRLFLVADDARTPRFRARVASLASALAGEASGGARRARAIHPGDLNQALIELGALVCRPRVPRCERCPVASLCGARAEGREGSLPRGRRRAVARRMRIAVGICERGGRVLLVRRPGRGLFAGMWSPPTVELAPGDDAAAAISNEIEREPSATTGGFAVAGTIERKLTHRTLELVVLTASLARLPRKRGAWLLAAPEELGALGVPAAMRHALAQAGYGRAARRPSITK
jgi:A/G-specific adenine glycosylase